MLGSSDGNQNTNLLFYKPVIFSRALFFLLTMMNLSLLKLLLWHLKKVKERLTLVTNCFFFKIKPIIIFCFYWEYIIDVWAGSNREGIFRVIVYLIPYLVKRTLLHIVVLFTSRLKITKELRMIVLILYLVKRTLLVFASMITIAHRKNNKIQNKLV